MKLFILLQLLLLPAGVFAQDCIEIEGSSLPHLEKGATNPSIAYPFSPTLFCAWHTVKSWLARSNVEIKEGQYAQYFCEELDIISQGNKTAQNGFVSNIDFSAIPPYHLLLKSFEVYCPNVQQMSEVRECQDMERNWSKHPNLTCSEYFNDISTEEYRSVTLDHVTFVDSNKGGYMDAILDLTVDLYGSQANGDIKVILTRKSDEENLSRIGLGQ